MLIEELKQQAERLDAAERRQLATFLVELDLADDLDYWAEVRRRSEDPAAENWVDVRILKQA